MALSDELRSRVEHVWQKLLEHPFVVKLYNGTLPLSKFKYYALQDYYFLFSMVKILSIVAAKAPDIESSREVLKIAYSTVTVEMANYEELLKRLDLKLSDALATEPNPTNVAYVNFLLSTAYASDYWTTLSSILPCFWSYEEIAQRHAEELKRNEVAVYRDWASVYLSDEYRSLVKELRGRVDSSGKRVIELLPVFELATKYEYMFWSASYNEERWPV